MNLRSISNWILAPLVLALVAYAVYCLNLFGDDNETMRAAGISGIGTLIAAAATIFAGYLAWHSTMSTAMAQRRELASQRLAAYLVSVRACSRAYSDSGAIFPDPATLQAKGRLETVMGESDWIALSTDPLIGRDMAIMKLLDRALRWSRQDGNQIAYKWEQVAQELLPEALDSLLERKRMVDSGKSPDELTSIALIDRHKYEKLARRLGLSN